MKDFEFLTENQKQTLIDNHEGITEYNLEWCNQECD